MEHNNTIHVFTGKLRHAQEPKTLFSSAIGSCVVVIAYSSLAKTGIMAHVMLPGNSPNDRETTETKYAINAIKEVIWRIEALNLPLSKFCFAIVGGANVIEGSKSTIGIDNIISIKSYLEQKGIPIIAESIGGHERRSAKLELSTGKLYVAIGDGREKLLVNFQNRPSCEDK